MERHGLQNTGQSLLGPQIYCYLLFSSELFLYCLPLMGSLVRGFSHFGFRTMLLSPSLCCYCPSPFSFYDQCVVAYLFS